MAAPRKTATTEAPLPPAPSVTVDEPEGSLLIAEAETLPEPHPEDLGQLTQPQVVSPMVQPAPGEPVRQPSVQAMGFNPPQVIVGQVQRTPIPPGDRPVKIRVNEDIQDMTITSGGKIRTYNFTAGHEYVIPRSVAIELARIDRLWH